MKNSAHHTETEKAVSDKRRLLEQSRLSKLPEFALKCIVCEFDLTDESDFLRRIKVCPGCLQIYSKIDAAITAASDQAVKQKRNFRR